MSPITTHRRGSIAIITSDSPPVNALGAAVRQGLHAAIQSAEADDRVTAIVILCRGKTFFAGADITEFGKPRQDPILPDLVDRIEAATKPVIAAIHGTALGGGLELALACHYRVAIASARLGLPEVKLGIIPGAAGTQRLPRLTGIETALDMIATGDPVGARAALAAGLVDRVVEEPLEDAAVAFAGEIADIRPVPRTSERQDRIGSAAEAILAANHYRARNARKLRGRDAPEAAIRAVEAAAANGFRDGVKIEHDLFWALMNGDQARAQQYLFFAERKAAKVDDLPADTGTRPIDRVGVIGAGTMGTGISMNFLNAGIPVTLVELSDKALERGSGTIARTYARDVEKGRSTEEKKAAKLALLHPTLDFAELAGCDLVIEAVFEEMAIKKEIFRKLDAVCKPGAILASNTSFLNIDEMATETGRSADVLGLHFFSPANIMKLLEVVRGAQTAPDVLQTAMSISRKIGKVPVVAGVCHGFIGNRMLMKMVTQTNMLILEGATPDQVDQAHMAFGMPMGPFRTADLAGLDLGWHRDPNRADTVIEALCAIGRWGQKTGKGFYDYDEGRNAAPSDEVAAIIDRFRARAGIAPRAISEDEIVARSFYPLVNEGAKVLEEGFSQRGSDIDVVWIYGYGWPRHKGGPMFWGDLESAAKIVETLDGYGTRLGPDFSISPLLRRAAAEHLKLSQLSATDLDH